MIREVNEAGVNLIKSFEGIPDGDPTTVPIDPYLDPVGIWTLGWGHALTIGTRFLRGEADRALVKSLYPKGVSFEQCVVLLKADLIHVGAQVLAVVKIALTENQYAALVAFTFNLGIGNLQYSTLLRKLNAGGLAGAADEFLKWDKAGGKALPGLTRRRQAERALFLSA